MPFSEIDVVALGPFLLAGIERRDQEDQRRRFGGLGQPQIADDLLALERNFDHFERRIEIARIGKIGLDAFGIGLLLLRRIVRRVMGELVVARRGEKFAAGLGRPAGLFCRPARRHVTVADRHPGTRPFVAIERVDVAERLAHLVERESLHQASLRDFRRALDDLVLELIDAAVRHHVGGPRATDAECEGSSENTCDGPVHRSLPSAARRRT